MAYNTKPIITDKDGNPISQYYNPETDSYEPVEGQAGANKVLVVNNDLSLIPILEKLSQLTGSVIDEETRKQNETTRQNNEQERIQLYNNLLAELERIEQIDKQVPETVLEAINALRDELGNLEDLETIDKSSIINAINEVNTKIDEIGIIDRDAENVSYDNTESGLVSNNVQAVIDEVYADLTSHKVEKATQDKLGHVIVDGITITIDENGVISAEAGGQVKSVNGKTGEVVIDVGDIAGLVSSSLALGYNASAWNSAVALGYKASAGSNSVGLGRETSAGDQSVAIGWDASAVGNYAVALGYNASATGLYSVVLGSRASAVGNYTVALGDSASAQNNNEGALGNTASKWKVPGNFTVSGTKNFEIPHPKPEKKATYVIRHGAVESPTPGDTLYRWRVQASKDNDLVTIDLPDYFIWLNTNVQIFVTPQGHFGNGYGELNRETEQLEIHCQYEGEYNVLVIGTRNDDHPSVQEWYIKGVEREIGESWTGETYAFEVDEISGIEEIKEVSA